MGELPTLGARVLAVRKQVGKTQIEMAKFLGLSTTTWQKIERDEGLPSGETLLAFERLGINPGWVLSGLGPRDLGTAGDTPKPSVSVDIEILQQLHDAVQAVFAECKQTPPPRAVTAEAGELYNELLKMVSDVRDRAVVAALIPVLRQRFRDRIESAEPGTGKREAS